MKRWTLGLLLAALLGLTISSCARESTPGLTRDRDSEDEGEDEAEDEEEDDGDQTGRRDAGRDAGRRDAGRDAGNRDAGSDGRRDAGPDAGRSDGGDIAVDGGPDGASVEAAPPPEMMPPMMTPPEMMPPAMTPPAAGTDDVDDEGEEAAPDAGGRTPRRCVPIPFIRSCSDAGS